MLRAIVHEASVCLPVKAPARRGRLFAQAKGILPGIEEHEAQHGPVLGIVAQPDSDVLFEGEEAMVIVSHEAVQGDVERVGIRVAAGARHGLIALLCRYVVAQFLEVADRLNQLGEIGRFPRQPLQPRVLNL